MGSREKDTPQASDATRLKCAISWTLPCSLVRYTHKAHHGAAQPLHSYEALCVPPSTAAAIARVATCSRRRIFIYPVILCWHVLCNPVARGQGPQVEARGFKTVTPLATRPRGASKGQSSVVDCCCCIRADKLLVSPSSNITVLGTSPLCTLHAV